MKTPWWFLHKTPLAFLLLPISWIYAFFSGIVFHIRKLFVFRSERKIICIGNILAGGVGKTPIVRAVANYFNAPVVMRGYKRNKKDGSIGDEATMLSQDGIQVHVGDRKSNLILLNKQLDKKTPIIMDDGFQNSTIKKDVSILVFDEKLGLGNGFRLPAGPLRQTKKAIKKADCVIIIKSDSLKKSKKIPVPESVPVFYAYNKTISPFDESQRLVAFAGIGYPKKFFNSLKNVVYTKSFPDHYQYSEEDIKKLYSIAKKKNAKLITTEKDWVRLSDEDKQNINFAKLETVIEDGFFDWLKEKIK